MIKLFEKYKDLSEIKDTIFLTAVRTLDIDIIESFLQRDYDMNVDNVLYEACENDDVFRYFLEKDIDIEKQIKNSYKFRNEMSNLNIQEILIDFGYEQLIFDTVGFHKGLKDNQKYSSIVDMYDQAKQYNL